MSLGLRIRQEMPDDIAAIDAVTVAAFMDAPHTSHTEQFIVAALRAAGALSVSLVAEAGGASLCVGISQQFVDGARKRNGQHAHTSVRVFMNDIAAGAFRNAAATYPVGAVIVKGERKGTFCVRSKVEYSLFILR